MVRHEYGLRELRASDAAGLVDAYVKNRAHLAPWEPVRPDSFFTVDGQRAAIEQRLTDNDAGRGASWVLTHREEIVGRVDLSNVARGPFQSCSLGYWVRSSANGRGHATAATAAMLRLAFGELDLHRVEAGILPHNAASQRVLEKVGMRYERMADYGSERVCLYAIEREGER